MPSSFRLAFGKEVDAGSYEISVECPECESVIRLGIGPDEEREEARASGAVIAERTIDPPPLDVLMQLTAARIATIDVLLEQVDDLRLEREALERVLRAGAP